MNAKEYAESYMGVAPSQITDEQRATYERLLAQEAKNTNSGTFKLYMQVGNRTLLIDSFDTNAQATHALSKLYSPETSVDFYIEEGENWNSDPVETFSYDSPEMSELWYEPGN